MTRRTFVEALRAGQVDPYKEYSKLRAIFYEPAVRFENIRKQYSIAEVVNLEFKNYSFRGTCIRLKEFDEKYGFNFPEQPENFCIDSLIEFAEYLYAMISELKKIYDTRFNAWEQPIDFEFILNQLERIIEEVGYIQIEDDGFTIFVPKDSAAIAISESDLISDDLSYKVLEYNHHSMSGDIERKKQTLLSLAEQLEANKEKLIEVDSGLSRDLFFALNTCNIRHNNINQSSKNYKQAVAELSSRELEDIYDNIYRMCLAAFLKIEYLNFKPTIDELKKKIDNNS